MNKIMRIDLFFTFIGIILSINISAQNIEKMSIVKMLDQPPLFIDECTPKNLIIIINSAISNLQFESNMLPNNEFIVVHKEKENQYYICHEKIKFKLIISGPNLQTEEIEIFNLKQKQIAYRISANSSKGTLKITTTPDSANLIFTTLGNLELSSKKSLTNNSGIYPVKIIKSLYEEVNTEVTIKQGDTTTYYFDLEPIIPRMKIDLKTNDKAPFANSPTIWIDSERIDLESFVDSGLTLRSFREGVEFCRLYEDNIIPVTEGYHKIKIEAMNYLPFDTVIQAVNREFYDISVSLEPVFGYLTFVDKQSSEGASIFINDQNIGKVPLSQKKKWIGSYKVRFEKSGYTTLEKEYEVVVEENQNTDIDVSMIAARKISFSTNPTYAEVLMDHESIGFTPCSIIAKAGNHGFIVRKDGFATEKLSRVINELSAENDFINLDLHPVDQIIIRGEEKGLLVHLKGLGSIANIEIDSTSRTPANLLLPYGKYEISLSKDKRDVYKSTITHSQEIYKRGILPNYSRTSFHFLTGSYENKDNYEASLGRIYIFPRLGLSTALINVDYKFLQLKTDSITYDSIPPGYKNPKSPDTLYSFNTLAPNIFFLNWEWRLGGAVLRQLDVNLLGRAKYSPGLTLLNKPPKILNDPNYSVVEMQNYFFGVEISSRLSYLNVCLRFGRQFNIGKVNVWDADKGTYVNAPMEKINESRNVATIGVTINGKVFKSNNMLRLWNRPLIDPALPKSVRKKATKNFFKSINIFN